ncbi:hypothetical protein CTEN210_03403 [Chaetoceros tenuissimus]|uniref:Helicase-associated domain-containing protein n=1 Tax=Chaetoceros tenuissimus TaxID=426638 RepID=A0AAD3CJP5_9STRA|nr:hypothetical protein CTEN210_03403 [Chaetoceros tenuissimus]
MKISNKSIERLTKQLAEERRKSADFEQKSKNYFQTCKHFADNNLKLGVQLEDAQATIEALEKELEALKEKLAADPVQSKRDGLIGRICQVIAYIEGNPNWEFKNLTPEQRKDQGTFQAFEGSQPLAKEVFDFWTKNEKLDPVTKQVLLIPECVKAANKLYWDHGFLPPQFKGVLGNTWNCLRIGTFDSKEGTLTDLNCRAYNQACNNLFVSSEEQALKGNSLGFMYTEQCYALLVFNCVSLAAEIKKDIKKYAREDKENAFLYRLYDNMDSLIAQLNDETRLVHKTVFREYVKVMDFDEIHDFSSKNADDIFVNSSEIITIFSEEKPLRNIQPVKTPHLCYAQKNSFSLDKHFDSFSNMVEGEVHSVARKEKGGSYSEEEVTVMLCHKSKTGMTILQQLLSNFAIIRKLSPEAKKIISDRIRERHHMKRAAIRKRKMEEEAFSEETGMVVAKKMKISESNRELTDLRIEMYNAKWEKRYDALVAYKKEHGDCLVPRGFPNLGDWVPAQRKMYKKLRKSIVNGKTEIEWSPSMTKARFEKLDKLGFDWDPDNTSWEMNYNALVVYKEEYGHCLVPRKYKKNETLLGSWMANQRTLYMELQESIKPGKTEPEWPSKKLTKARFEKLNKLGFVWFVKEATWEKNYNALVAYKKEYGHCCVPQGFPENPKLANWVSNQRVLYKKLQEKGNGESETGLTKDRIEKLNELGFVWKVI